MVNTANTEDPSISGSANLQHDSSFGLPYIFLSLFIIIIVTASIFLSRLPAANFAELSPFWPVTGIAIALLQLNRWHIINLALGVILWAYFAQMPLMITLLLPLTLLGPWVYSLLRNHSKSVWLGRRKPDFVFSDYLAIGFIALLPSSVIGTVLYHQQLQSYSFVDTFFVYGLADFLGVLIFLPLTQACIDLYKQNEWPSIQAILLTTLLSALPASLKVYGLTSYASAAEVLLFPLFAIMISRYNRQSLIFSTFVLSIIITLSAGYGAQQLDTNLQIEAFLFVTFWLISVVLATQVLHQSTSKQAYLIHKNEFMATHHATTHLPNKIQLQKDFAQSPPDYINLIQIKDRDTITQTLSTTETESLESQIAAQLSDLLNNVQIYHIAEMRFVILSDNNLIDEAQSLQRIAIDLGNQDSNTQLSSQNYIELAWGLMRCNQDDYEKNMTQASAALNIALQQPNLRIFGPTRTPQLEAQLSKLSLYQSYMQAMENDGLQIYYQPILNLQEGKITSAELLSRLYIRGKLISPAEFTELLKSFDALGKFDRIVIHKAAQQLSAKPLQRLQRININISGASLSDKGFINWLSNNLKASDYPHQIICFEITESDHIRDWHQAEQNALSLVNLGFQLAIDDFGAGLASFEYLKKFQMAKLLKIDGQFVNGIAKSPKQQAFVKATMMIAQSHHLDVCAEYVDNQATVNYLTQLGVKYAQGYYVSKPLLLANS